MANKNRSLLDAISGAANKNPSVRAVRHAPEIATNDDAPKPAKQASREGKVSMTIWLDRDYKTSMRAIQVKEPERQLQDLITEALNDLFAKYDVPVVTKDEQRVASKRRA